jgi:hypothetical protein
MINLKYAYHSGKNIEAPRKKGGFEKLDTSITG